MEKNENFIFYTQKNKKNFVEKYQNITKPPTVHDRGNEVHPKCYKKI